jgi:hypothetical protein
MIGAANYASPSLVPATFAQALASQRLTRPDHHSRLLDTHEELERMSQSAKSARLAIVVGATPVAPGEGTPPQALLDEGLRH